MSPEPFGSARNLPRQRNAMSAFLKSTVDRKIKVYGKSNFSEGCIAPPCSIRTCVLHGLIAEAQKEQGLLFVFRERPISIVMVS